MPSLPVSGASMNWPPVDRPLPVERITHLEIRRVQNGWVVMSFDFRNHSHEIYPAQRSSFVATDIPGLLSVIQGIAVSTEVDWMPSVDLPIVDLVRRNRVEGATTNSHE